MIHSPTLPRRITANRQFLAVCALLLLWLSLGYRTAASQTDSLPDGRRPVVTRAELEGALAQAEQVVNGPFSETMKEDKRAEAALIRERLQDGDFQVGDQIQLSVAGESTLTATVTVQSGRILSLPNLPDIPMRGILRSEVQQYLTEQIGRFIKDPIVKASPLIRLSVFGAINQPGFHQLPADMNLSDALMAVGGPRGTAELEKSKIRRGDEEIVTGKEFRTAISAGTTLDQLNLRAGDEIIVEEKTNRNWFTTLRTVAIIPGLILSFYGLGRLAGVF